MTSPRIRWLKLPVGLAIAAGFVWLLVRELNPDLLRQAFTGLSISAVLVALLFVAAAQGVRIVRWWWMLRTLEPTLPLAACARPYLSSVAVNNVLPFRMGDALRVLGFRRQLGSPAMRILGTLVIERVLDVIFVSAVLFLGLLGLSETTLPRDFITLITWLAGAGLAVMLVLVLVLPLLERASRRWHFPKPRLFSDQRWFGIVIKQGTHLVRAFSLVRSIPRMAALIGMTAIIWAFEGAVFVVVAASLQAGVSLLAPWLSMAAGSLATAIPSAPGYVGTFDYFATQGFVVYGASPEVALAIALTVHATWIPLTIVGLLHYWLPFLFSGLPAGQRKTRVL